MITRDVLDNLAKKLMFKMNDEEYKTLENEFDVILKQMEFTSSIQRHVNFLNLVLVSILARSQ